MKLFKDIRSAWVLAPLMFCLLSISTLYAQRVPPPESVRLDDLNYMTGFPPANDKTITNHIHTRELVPTRNIRRGNTSASPLPVAARDLTDFAFEADKGRPTTVGKWMTETYTDALIVFRRGKIIYERIPPKLQLSQPVVSLAQRRRCIRSCGYPWPDDSLQPGGQDGSGQTVFLSVASAAFTHA